MVINITASSALATERRCVIGKVIYCNIGFTLCSNVDMDNPKSSHFSSSTLSNDIGIYLHLVGTLEELALSLQPIQLQATFKVMLNF